MCTSLHHKLHSLHPEKNNGLLWTFGGGGHERISQSFTQSYWNKKNRVIYLNMFIISTHLLCIYTAASVKLSGERELKKKSKNGRHTATSSAMECDKTLYLLFLLLHVDVVVFFRPLRKRIRHMTTINFFFSVSRLFLSMVLFRETFLLIAEAERNN